MLDPDDIADAIAENAAGPKSVTSDGMNVSQHSIGDQIKAQRHLENEEAAGQKHRGLRITKLRSPGAN